MLNSIKVLGDQSIDVRGQVRGQGVKVNKVNTPNKVQYHHIIIDILLYHLYIIVKYRYNVVRVLFKYRLNVTTLSLECRIALFECVIMSFKLSV